MIFKDLKKIALTRNLRLARALQWLPIVGFLLVIVGMFIFSFCLQGCASGDDSAKAEMMRDVDKIYCPFYPWKSGCKYFDVEEPEGRKEITVYHSGARRPGCPLSIDAQLDLTDECS